MQPRGREVLARASARGAAWARRERPSQCSSNLQTYLSVLAPGLVVARPLLLGGCVMSSDDLGRRQLRMPRAREPLRLDLEVWEALKLLPAHCFKGSAGINAWRVLELCSQARSTSDSVSLLSMIMNPERVSERAKDLNDMKGKVDCWDAMVRDYDMEFRMDEREGATCSGPRDGSRGHGGEKARGKERLGHV